MEGTLENRLAFRWAGRGQGGAQHRLEPAVGLETALRKRRREGRGEGSGLDGAPWILELDGGAGVLPLKGRSGLAAAGGGDSRL